MGSSPREHGKREFSARLASASVCFPSFKRASVTRSDLIGYKLLTIHSFMNHEFILVLPQCPFSFISAIFIGIFATLLMLAATISHHIISRHGRAPCGLSHDGGSPLDVSPRQFQTVRSVKKNLLVLSRSVSRRRETCQAVVCDCVKCPYLVSVLLKTSSQLDTLDV